MATKDSTHQLEASCDIANWLQDWTFNQIAFAALWEHFFPRLVGIAEKNMNTLPSRARDGEDVALSAFKDVYLACADGRYDIKSRDELWRLLLFVTLRKVMQERRSQLRQKRGGAVAHIGNSDGEEFDPIARLIDDSPTPEMMAQVHEQCRNLINSLDEEGMRRTIEMKLEGCSNAEISDLLGCTIDTTRYRLKKIRETWLALLDQEQDH